MSGFFDDFDGGRTLRAATAAAMIASAASTALGLAAERFAERELALRAFLSAPVGGKQKPAIDYAATGAIGGECRREIVVLGPCSEPERGAFSSRKE